MSEDGTTAIDPVCKMQFSRSKAVASTEYDGRSYYFCTDACLQQFVADPRRYVSAEG